MIAKIIPWFIFAVFGFFLVGNTWQAKLGMIDDHEIVMFLGQDGKIKLNEITKIISSTEVGQWGEYPRFRPSYYTLRVLEATFWKDNAMLWYGTRYLMLVVCLTLTYLILSRFIPKILSFTIVLYLMTLPLWSDILTRLGPSEIYAAFGLALFSFGLMKEKYYLWFIGYLISVGSKENMLFMLPILLFWLAVKIWNKTISKKEIILGVVATLYTAWIIAGIGLATIKIGTDVYGTQISYKDRIMTLWSYKRYITDTQHLYFSLIATTFMTFVAWKNRDTRKYLIMMLIVGGTVASQYIFYNNTLPTNMRYDFPGVIALRLLDVISFAWIWSYLSKSNKGWIKGLTLLIAVTIMANQIYHNGYKRVQNQIVKVVSETGSFDKNITKSVNDLNQDTKKPILIVANNYLDYEPIVSISRFLRARRVSNSMTLYYYGEVTEDDNVLARELETEMLEVMNEGANSKTFFQFSKYIEHSDDYYCIILGSAPPLPACAQSTHF